MDRLAIGMGSPGFDLSLGLGLGNFWLLFIILIACSLIISLLNETSASILRKYFWAILVIYVVYALILPFLVVLLG